MSDVSFSSDVTPPVCHFFRDVFADPYMTEHDISLVANHTRQCSDCRDIIGQMVNIKVKSNKQADASSGT